jgi:hypothetical protein
MPDICRYCLSKTRSAALMAPGEGHLQGLREGNAVKALGLALLALGAFLTFIVASSYHAWQSFGIIVLIGGLVTFAAGCVPAE